MVELLDGAVLSSENLADGTSLVLDEVSGTFVPITDPDFENDLLAGDVSVRAESILLDNEAAIATNTFGRGGNIELAAPAIVLRRNSPHRKPRTGKFPGGSIVLDTSTLAAADNGDITANAANDRGGQIAIDATSIFGLQSRSSLTSQSDITAFSKLGTTFSGDIDIGELQGDPGAALVDLSATFIDATGALERDPCRNFSRSRFTVTGRSGLPRTPRDGRVAIVQRSMGVPTRSRQRNVRTGR